MKNKTYNLAKIKAPRMAGSAFRIFAAVLETSFPGTLLAKKLMDDSGITALTKTSLKEDISPLPLHFDQPSRVRLKGDAGNSLSGYLQIKETGNRDKDTAGSFRPPTIDDYASAYRNGSSDPVKVAERLIELIKESNSTAAPLNAVIKYNENDILRQAEESLERHLDGKPLSIFDGVPIAVKDEIDQAGYTTSVGTSFLGTEKAKVDAEAVRRLRKAGALLFGKTNMHEIGIGVTGLNPHFGVVRNPHNPLNYTGGSSSGSAAAVAAGLCPGAVGADGGGSVRIPAALCGVTGLKPTYGRISETGAAPLCWSVAHIGPLGATVRDTALMYAVMAGKDPRMHSSLIQPDPDLAGIGKDLKGLRIGYYPEWFFDCDNSIHGVIKDTLKRLKDLGAEVVEIEIPELEEMRVAHLISIVSEMTTAMHPYYKEHRRDFGLDTRVNLALGKRFSNIDYIHAQRMRTRAINIFSSLFAKVDAIVTPSTGVPAPAIPPDALPAGESNLKVLSDIMRYAFPGNLTGLPAISVPAGYTEEGLPAGLQILGRAWEESLILRIAAGLENGIRYRRPELFYPSLRDRPV